jgi:branched-chain amino acid transport system substrate-binding protein
MPSTAPVRLGRRLRRTTAVLGATSLLALAGCGGGSLSGSSDEGGGDGPVKIGLVLPASGVYEPLGIDMTRGFELYLDEHDNQLGGYEVDVVEADEGEGPDTGVPAVNKVVTQDGVSAVVGIVNSSTALGVKESMVSSKVPLIAANAGADELADGSEYLWRTSFTNGGVGEAMGAALAEQLDGGSVYLMASGYAAGEESIAGFTESFEAAGGEIAGTSLTPFGTTSDFQPFLTKAQNSGADAIYSFYAGAEAVSFVQQYASFGLKNSMPLYGAGFLTEGGVLAAQGDAAVGVRTALHYTDQIDTPENQEFVDAYTSAYDAAPTVYSVQAYDAAAALDLALEQADGTSGEDIAAALGEVGEIESPRGTWSFDEEHNPDQPYFLREVESGQGGLVNAVVDEIE